MKHRGAAADSVAVGLGMSYNYWVSGFFDQPYEFIYVVLCDVRHY
jgi:hypothetical protein